MSTSWPPDALPLTGADCFLRAFDAEVRRMAGASHASQLVLRLGQGFDVSAFAKTLEEVVRVQPILRAPMRRAALFGAPVYRLDLAARAPQPVVEVHEMPGAPGPVPDLAFERMNGRFRGRRGELLRFDVFRYDGGRATDVVMTWLHMLFDGAGSEAFVTWLDRVHRGELGAADLPDGDRIPHPGLPEGIPGAERGRRAMAWQRHTRSFGERPTRSPAGPLRRVPQRLRYDVWTLDPEPSARIVARASARAGFLTPMLAHLAAAIRAHHAVFEARGAVPPSYVVPLPVNLRPKGADEALFRTRVSLLWFQVDSGLVSDADALLEELKRQRRESIKARQVENGALAMDYARYAPMRVYAHMARRALAGELCTFFFAYTGEFAPDADTFVGAPIERAFHAPPVPPSPGSSLALSLRRGRLNVTHVFQEGVFRPEERELLRERLLTDLTGP